MVFLKAKYKTLLRVVCGGAGTDQMSEFNRAVLSSLRGRSSFLNVNIQVLNQQLTA